MTKLGKEPGAETPVAPVSPLSPVDKKVDVAAAAEVSGIAANLGKDAVSAASNLVREVDFDNKPLRSRVGAVLDASKAERQLTPKQKEAALATLATRFAANENLHKGVEWTKVKESLEAKPEALWSINEMEKAGHEPDVYNADDRGFDIGTCSKESPESGKNCVFDEEAAQFVLKNNPKKGKFDMRTWSWLLTQLGIRSTGDALVGDREKAKFNGSAMAMAKAMGINLMDPDLYKNVLQKKGKFDMRTWSWLLTQLDIRSTGDALVGDRDGVDCARVGRFDANFHHADRSWRGSLRVEWAA